MTPVMLVLSRDVGSIKVTMDKPVSMSAMEPAKLTMEVHMVAAKPISSPTTASFITITAYSGSVE